jgi:putative transposase
MPHGLKRFQQSGQSHFVTFTCYHRRVRFNSAALSDLFVEVLENMRRRFHLCVYGYVVMPEHVHLLMSEPERGLLADAIHFLKLSFAKRACSLLPQDQPGRFWQMRYYDRNVRNYHEFTVKCDTYTGTRCDVDWSKNRASGSGAVFAITRFGKKE